MLNELTNKDHSGNKTYLCQDLEQSELVVLTNRLGRGQWHMGEGAAKKRGDGSLDIRVSDTANPFDVDGRGDCGLGYNHTWTTVSGIFGTNDEHNTPKYSGSFTRVFIVDV